MSKVFESINKFFSLPLIKKIKEIFKKLSQNRWLGYITFLYVIVFLMFLIPLIRNSFTIPVSGDFTLQQIPFYYNGYDDWWTFLTSGKFVMWDDSAMLGVNNIGANSFYYLFNPFFLILLIVPRDILPQAQAFMMMTKMVLAGVTMKLLLEQFKLKEETTWLFGVVYAFCGYNLYYLWFNHFLEITVLMPLMLLGIEKVIRYQKPKLLIISLFLTGITNYFFLIAFCFCGVIYAGFRFFQNLKNYHETIKYEQANNIKRLMDIRLETFLVGFFAFACGLMLASFVLFPCFSVAINNDRVGEQTYLQSLLGPLKVILGMNNGSLQGPINLINTARDTLNLGNQTFADAIKDFFANIFIWSEDSQKRLLYPLIGFLTPNFSCFDSAVIGVSSYDNTYASLFIFTPIMLFLIPSLMNSIRKRKYSSIVGLGLGLILLFTPFAYYCFSGFTEVAYARWYVFVIAVMVLFIAVNFDQIKDMKKYYLDISVAVVIFLFGLMLFKAEQLYNDSSVSNLKVLDSRRAYAFAELAYIIIMYIYLRRSLFKNDLTQNLRYFVSFEAIVMALITVLMGQGTVSYDSLYGGEKNWKEEIEIAQTILEEDDDYYRVFSTSANRDNNNFAMMMGTPGIGTFHSIYNTNLDKFIDWSDISYSKTWSMGVHEKKINLDEFLAIKYYILKDDDTNVPFGFNEYLSTNDHTVYINENYLQLGFAFDNIISSTYMTSTTPLNEFAYLQGAILDNDVIEQYFGENNTFFPTLESNELRNGITYVSPNNDKIDVYRAIWENDVLTGYQEPVKFTSGASGTTSQMDWGSYLDVDLSSYNIGGETETRGKCYLTVQARMGENLDITLYGEDENGEEYVITHDTHMVHWYARNAGDWKKWRGFYVDDKVTRMEIKVNETMRTFANNSPQYLEKPNIYYQYEDTYLDQLKPLKENALLNVEHDTNYFSFETNFDKEKIVVLQIPYDQGWSIKMYDSNNDQYQSPDLFISHGGFIAFISPKGQYRYELHYYTPNLKVGLYFTYGGIILLCGYQLLTINREYQKYKYHYPFDSYLAN